MSGFPAAQPALETYANALNTIADGVAQPVDSWMGKAGEQHAESMQALALYLRRVVEVVNTAAAACETQSGFDEELKKAPTPEEVEEAKEHLKEVQDRAVAGIATDAELTQAMEVYQTKKGDRDRAVEQHRDDTTGTVIPQDIEAPPSIGGDVCTPTETTDPGGTELTADGGAGIAEGEEEVGGDGTAADSGVDIPPPNQPTPTEPTPTEPSQGAAPAATDTPAPSPAPAGLNSSVPSQPEMPPVSADAAHTELTTDGGARVAPQAGSLGGAVPMQQQPQQMTGGGAPGFTTAGTMISQPNQQAPQQQRSSNQHRGDDGKLNETGIGAILGHSGAAVAGASAAGAGMAAATTPPISTAATAPSAATPSPTAAPAPGATPPPVQSSGTPASGAAPIGMMGAGNTTRGQNAAAAPKPEPKPAVNRELLDRVDDLLKGGDPKPNPSPDPSKRAS
ncbi:hypothetical protein [Mycobacterium avium]|uniref:hypothetical protein n=1 Tax=Mycobacterium avium TaxID=1764 RepID=UPI0003D23BF3|nr:hypothetical protein [Mycobacterium avium]ETA93314.1 hypothetical protein O984_09465 [Mycobacterium avium 05-4293]